MGHHTKSEQDRPQNLLDRKDDSPSIVLCSETHKATLAQYWIHSLSQERMLSTHQEWHVKCIMAINIEQGYGQCTGKVEADAQ